MKVLSVEAVAEIINKHGFDAYFADLKTALRRDFGRWQEFVKMPRPNMETEDGTLELMPIRDNTYHMFKYVNCYPKNPLHGKQTVIATGQLSRVSDGYPVVMSEMTVLTALRTAATTVLATDLLARQGSRVMALIGTGAQSEFHMRAIGGGSSLTEVRYFDIDAKAMDKFERNVANSPLKLVRCRDAKEAVVGADIITVCTACRGHMDVIKNDWVKPGMHINGLGGDCPGKTELELGILPRSRIVTDYFDQAVIDGEIQRLDNPRKHVYAELHELITGAKTGRDNAEQITLYDSVGMALEDYSALRLTYELAEKYGIGQDLNLTPPIKDPKNLISVLSLPD